LEIEYGARDVYLGKYDHAVFDFSGHDQKARAHESGDKGRGEIQGDAELFEVISRNQFVNQCFDVVVGADKHMARFGVSQGHGVMVSYYAQKEKSPQITQINAD
jgi:hypothetical protein